MPVFIHFKSKRLHVGYRLRDWRDVYFQRAPEDDQDQQNGKKKKAAEDDGFEFAIEDRKAVWQAPKQSEICFHGHFDPTHFGSRNWADKLEIQREMLRYAFAYLGEQDPEKARGMEDELDDPRHTHWQSWFDEAKKWKGKKFRVKAKRVKNAVKNGVPVKVASEQAGWDTSESGYESQDMRPPPRPSAAGKRRANGVHGVGSERGSKRRAGTGSSRDPRSPSLRMSGGCGGVDGWLRGRADGGNVGDADDEDDEGNWRSNMYDPRPPQGATPSVIDGREGNLATPPPTGRRNHHGQSIISGQHQVNGNPSASGVSGGENGRQASGSSGLFVTGNTPSRPDTGAAQDYNGGLHGKAALDRAISESEAPENRHNGGLNEKEAIERAVSESMATESRPRDSIVAGSGDLESGNQPHADELPPESSTGNGVIESVEQGEVGDNQ